MQNVSQQDIQAMQELTQLMDDIDSGAQTKPLQHNNQTNIPNELLSVCSTDTTGDPKAMYSIMEGLDSITGEYNLGKKNITEPQAQNVNPLYQEMMQYATDPYGNPVHHQSDQYENSNISYTTDVPSYKKPHLEYSVISENYKGTKISSFSIKNNYSSNIIADGIMLKECAFALCNMLNSKITLTNSTFVGVLSMGLQYSRLFESTASKIQKRQIVLKECNYEAAKEMDSSIKEGKEQADDIKTNMIRYLIKNNLSYK